MNAVAIIPARYASTRFPGKPLALLGGKPIIQHVYEACLKSKLFTAVIVATDNENISHAVSAFGGVVAMTSERHQSGTDRIAEAASYLDELDVNIDDYIVVNVQGDEPLIDTKTLAKLLDAMNNSDAPIGSLMTPITDSQMLQDPNIVKVITNLRSEAIYFSRSAIPFNRDSLPGIVYYRHIGVYAYRLKALKLFVSLPMSALEKIEKLEQLRALENSIPILMVKTKYQGIGIDTPQDLAKLETS